MMLEGGYSGVTVFLIDNTPPEEKVRIVSVHLSDKALLWHKQRVKTMRENVDWDMYKEEIIQIFCSVFEDPMVDLKNAKYDNNAKEYQDLFDILLYRVYVSEDHALSLYLGSEILKSFLVVDELDRGFRKMPSSSVVEDICNMYLSFHQISLQVRIADEYRPPTAEPFGVDSERISTRPYKIPTSITLNVLPRSQG
ncbi:hypothetical protein Tco_0950284 [Tanacetum coccineum]